MDPVDLTAFECPRCKQTTSAEYYGPCESCRDELRATVVGDSENIASADYEPKMNVTPNAVASKD